MFSNINVIIFCLVIVSASIKAQASRDDYCRLRPNQIGKVATKILENAHKKNKSFPLSTIIQSDFSGMISDHDHSSSFAANIEGFIRISKSGQFSILPLSIPLFAVDLNVERDIVYVCTHIDPDLSKYFFEVYFLTGYNLGESSMGSFVGDLLFQSVSVSGVVVNPISFDTGVDSIGAQDDSIFLKILASPLRLPMEIASQAQGLMMNALKTIIPMGIDRVQLTYQEVVLSSGVNLDDPTLANLHYRIPLTGR